MHLAKSEHQKLEEFFWFWTWSDFSVESEDFIVNVLQNGQQMAEDVAC